MCFIGGCIAPLILLAGCAGSGDKSAAGRTQAAFTASGVIMGGQSPIQGATVRLFHTGQTGATPGTIAVSISTTTSDANGAFTFPTSAGPANCPAGDVVYVTAAGGFPSGNTGLLNQQMLEAAVLGDCSAVSAGTYVFLNEVTTAAAANALAQYASSQPDPTQSSAVYQANINAAAGDATFGTAVAAAATYVNTVTGQPNSAAPSVSTATEQTKKLTPALVNTLADIIQSCVDTASTLAMPSQGCSTLFADTPDANGAASQNTFQALVNLALNPPAYGSSRASALQSLVRSTSAYQPTLSQPIASWNLATAEEDALISTLPVPSGSNLYYTDYGRGFLAAGTPIFSSATSSTPTTSDSPCPPSSIGNAGAVLYVNGEACPTRDVNTRYIWASLTDANGKYLQAYTTAGQPCIANPLMKDLTTVAAKGGKMSFHIQALVADGDPTNNNSGLLSFYYTGHAPVAKTAQDGQGNHIGPGVAFSQTTEKVWSAVPPNIVNDDNNNGWFSRDLPAPAGTNGPIYYVPDWNNAAFINAAAALLLSIRQDIDACGLTSAISFVNIGMYGNYGENENGGIPYYINAVQDTAGHYRGNKFLSGIVTNINDQTTILAPITNASGAEYVDMHVNAFGDKQLIVQPYQVGIWANAFARRLPNSNAAPGVFPIATWPFSGATPNFPVGWRADCFGHSLPGQACNVPVYEQSSYEASFNTGNFNGEPLPSTSVTTLQNAGSGGWKWENQWMYAPVMTETYDAAPTEATNPLSYQRDAALMHASAINELNFTHVLSTDASQTELNALATNMLPSLGYSFGVNNISLPYNLHCSGLVSQFIQSTWSNTGTAPAYKSFDTLEAHWIIRDSANNLLLDQVSSIDFSQPRLVQSSLTVSDAVGTFVTCPAQPTAATLEVQVRPHPDPTLPARNQPILLQINKGYPDKGWPASTSRSDLDTGTYVLGTLQIQP